MPKKRCEMTSSFSARMLNFICCSRYLRQRYSTILVRALRPFINQTLWPEYLEISLTLALEQYPHEAWSASSARRFSAM